MPNSLSALKRQIEILAFFYSKKNNTIYTTLDLAEKYDISEITINRDLRELRTLGIPINSVYNRGIEITGEISAKILTDLILKYLAIYNSNLILSKAFDYIKQSGLIALNLISTINNCIEKNSYLLIEINSPKIIQTNLKTIPYKIIDNNGILELVFIHNDIAESIKLEYIKYAKDLNENNKTDYRKKVSEFLNSNYNKKTSSFKIKLQIASSDSTKNFAINEIKLIEEDNNGIITVETSNSSLEDIAIWVMKQSGKVKIIEPECLVNKIKEMALDSIQYNEVSEEMTISSSKKISKEFVADSYIKTECDSIYIPNLEEKQKHLRKMVHKEITTYNTIELIVPIEHYF